MLQLDRNQHPATFVPPLISDPDQHKILSLSAVSRDSVHKDKIQNLDTSPASTLTPPPEHSSPRENGAAEPAPDTTVDSASRQSTPLSELSSPSNHGDTPEPEEAQEDEEEEEAENNAEDRGEEGPTTGTVENPEPLFETNPETPFTQKDSTLVQDADTPHPPDSVATNLSPSTSSPLSATSPTSSQFSAALDTKVVTILELNAELLKFVIPYIYMAFFLIILSGPPLSFKVVGSLRPIHGSTSTFNTAMNAFGSSHYG